MSTLEKVSAYTDGQDTSVIVDSDLPDRPPRAPPTPASVKINVEGAFIADDEVNERNSVDSEYVHRESNDIRLPHHTDVVSHVAVDVCLWRTSHLLSPTDQQFRSVALWRNSSIFPVSQVHRTAGAAYIS